MGEGQKFNHDAAGVFGALVFKKYIESTGIGLAWKDLIPIDQIQQRHRLLAQRMNDVPVVDDMARLAVVLWPTAPAAS